MCIGEVGFVADQRDGELPLRLTHTLENARVQNRRLVARVGADEQDRVGLVDAGDRRVEQIAGAPMRGIERGAVLAAVDIGRAQLIGEQLQREHLLGGGEVAGDRAKALAVEPLELTGDCSECLVPACRLKRAVTSDIGAVEPLRAQAVPYMSRLVGDPLLVDGVVDARQDAHHLAPARIDADGAAERVHRVDRGRLGQLPRPRAESIGL